MRNAITNVHLDLSHDISSVSEAVAERVNEIAQRIRPGAGRKGRAHHAWRWAAPAIP